MDTQYDVFIAGIQPEYQDNADQIIEEFASLFPEHQSLAEPLSQSRPKEYCLARKVNLQQAENHQRQLARIGLICRYRPAVDQQPDFSLEPLAPQTITCPFCQHTQPKPEKLQGKRCAHCHAKMVLFEKRQKILAKLQAQKAAVFPVEENAIIEEPPVTTIIRQTEQKLQHRRKQQVFSFGLIGFTLTAIVAITAFAAYQLSLQLGPQLPSPSHEHIVEKPVIKPKTASTPLLSPAERTQLLQQGLQPGRQLSADKLLAMSKNQPIDLNQISALPAIDTWANNAELAAPKELKALLETEKPLTPADTEKLVAALEQSIKSIPDNESMQQLLEQARTALPSVRNVDQIIEKPHLINPWKSRPNQPEQDIFTVLYAMEAFNQADKKKAQLLLRQYKLQKKLLQQYRQILAEGLNNPLNMSELQDAGASRYAFPRTTQERASQLNNAIAQWLYPETADIILSARFNPISR